MSSKEHVHKYRRVDIATKEGKEYWVMQCSLDGCTHYTPMKTKLSAPRLKGSKSICNRCGDTFVLDRRAIRMAEPCCFACVERKNPTELERAAQFFHKLEKSLVDQCESA
jgi:hypothetical protein